MTFKQLPLCISNMRRGVSAFNPNFGGLAAVDPLRTELIPAITSDQWDQMSTNGGIPVKSLPQQQLLRRIALFYLVQKRLSGLDDVEIIADRVALDDTIFTRQNAQGATYFGYDFSIKTASPQTPKRQFMVLNNASGKVSRYNIFRAKQDGSVSLGLSTKSDPDKSDLDKLKLDQSLTAEQKHVSDNERAASLQLTTVGDICARLNAQESKSPIENLKQFKVAAELSMLPITFIDLSSADSEAIWDAIASIYGVKVSLVVSDLKAGDNKITVYHMSSPTCKVAKDISDIPAALISSIPKPFLRACNQKLLDNRTEKTNNSAT